MYRLNSRRSLIQDLVAHVLAGTVVIGFFGLAFVILLGYLDLTDSTVTSFLGVILGYTVKLTESVLVRYFHTRHDSIVDTSDLSSKGPPKD